MSTLAGQVRVNRRFQRSVRVDTDIDEPSALDGFVCPPSTAQALVSMARQIAETGQGAFTWTGPYGSGKSSLAVALAALLGSDPKRRAAAKSAMGADASGEILALLKSTKGKIGSKKSKAMLASFMGQSIRFEEFINYLKNT